MNFARIALGTMVIIIIVPLLQPQVSFGTGVDISIVSGAALLGNNAFSPNPSQITVGDTVTWKNKDSALHRITSGNPNTGPDGTFQSTFMALDSSYSFTFNQPGNFPYYCQLHPTMSGSIQASSGDSEDFTTIQQNVSEGIDIGDFVFYSLFRSVSHSLAVNAVSADGKILHKWVTIFGSGDNSPRQVLKEGLSPLNFNGDGGKSYYVTISDFGDYVFDHWSGNNSTSRLRIVTLPSIGSNNDLELTAIYGLIQKPSNGNATIYLNSISKDTSDHSPLNMHVTVQDSNGTLVRSGYTPMSFVGKMGLQYRVLMSEYDGKIFERWQDDDSTGKNRLIEVSGNSTLTAIFDTGNATRGFTPLIYGGNSNQPDLAVNAAAVGDNRTLHVWMIINPKDTNSTDGTTTYNIYATNAYHDLIFDHWNDNGSTERVRTLTIAETKTITALYRSDNNTVPSPGLISLSGVSANTFNPTSPTLNFELTGAEFAPNPNFNMTINNSPLPPDNFERDAQHLTGPVHLIDGLNNITLSAIDILNRPIHYSSSFWAGNNSLRVNLIGENGTSYLGFASVSARLADDSSIKVQGNTTVGAILFENIPTRTILINATSENDLFGEVGETGDAGIAEIHLHGFNPPSDIANNDFSLGTAGWEIGSAPVHIIPHLEGIPSVQSGLAATDNSLKTANSDISLSRNVTSLHAAASSPSPTASAGPSTDEDLVVFTSGEGEQGVLRTFKTSDGTTSVLLRYRFITSEVPGGFYGTKFNDYFHVLLRSQQGGALASESNSMNGLGLGAFDFASGATDWREVELKTNPKGDIIQVEAGVANVADDLYDSLVVVDFVQEINCPSEEDLDKISAQYTSMIDDAKSLGWNVAANNLQHFLDGSGTNLNLDVNWLRDFNSVTSAEGTNQGRFQDSLKKIAAGMANGETRTFSDHWDHKFTANILTELYYASGTSTITSNGIFELTRAGDTVIIMGTVNHRWHDPYDWHAGLGAYIPGHGGVSDEDALSMQHCRGAKPYDMEATWTQHLSGTVKLNEFLPNSTDFRWSGP